MAAAKETVPIAQTVFGPMGAPGHHHPAVDVHRLHLVAALAVDQRRHRGVQRAVEFGDVPRAYSVLAYGESSRENSPYHADQAALFARGEMKKVLFLASDVDAGVVERYRPGEEKRR